MTPTGKKSIKKTQINNSFNTDVPENGSITSLKKSGQGNEILGPGITNPKDNDNFIRGTLTEYSNEDAEPGINPVNEIPIIEIPIIINN